MTTSLWLLLLNIKMSLQSLEEHLLTANGTENCVVTMGNNMEVPQKVKKDLPYESAITHGYIPKDSIP